MNTAGRDKGEGEGGGQPSEPLVNTAAATAGVQGEGDRAAAAAAGEVGRGEREDTSPAPAASPAVGEGEGGGEGDEREEIRKTVAHVVEVTVQELAAARVEGEGQGEPTESVVNKAAAAAGVQGEGGGEAVSAGSVHGEGEGAAAEAAPIEGVQGVYAVPPLSPVLIQRKEQSKPRSDLRPNTSLFCTDPSGESRIRCKEQYNRDPDKNRAHRSDSGAKTNKNPTQKNYCQSRSHCID